MPRIRPSRRLLLIAAALAVACTSDPVTLCGCSPPPDAAILYGRVTGPGGGPVQGALVVAERGLPGCATIQETLGEVRTAADGSYRTRAVAHMGFPRPGDCLRAFAAPPAGSTLRGSDTVAFAVQFATGEPLDSARVDLVLRAP
jgi:hypothetical protein